MLGLSDDEDGWSDDAYLSGDNWGGEADDAQQQDHRPGGKTYGPTTWFKPAAALADLRGGQQAEGLTLSTGEQPTFEEQEDGTLAISLMVSTMPARVTLSTCLLLLTRRTTLRAPDQCFRGQITCS